MINPMELTDKHVLITGGSSGIGRQCAVQASRLGARVTIIARREEELRETIRMTERPEEHACYPFDLSETDGIEALVRAIAAERGPVDGFVHAAGIGTSRMLRSSKPAYVEKMFRIHGFAFVELVRCLAQKGHANDGASFVGVSSVAAERGYVSQGAYAAAKAGMDGFVRPASKELSGRKIRVNTVAYAFVDTEMYQDFLDCGGDPNIEDWQNLGVIDLESAANAAMFLLSDACGFITGSTLPVYAGYSRG